MRELMNPFQNNILFEIDYKRLVLLLLPTFLRQPRIFAFFWAMAYAVSELHGQFCKQRNKNIRRIQNNGQVCHLQRLLNDEFDSGERRISVSGEDTDGDWLFAWDEEISSQLLVYGEPGSSKEKPIVPIVCNEISINSDTPFFTVSVPSSVTVEIDKLRNLLNEYKLLSKQYIIK